MNGGEQNQAHQIKCRGVYRCAHGPDQARGRQSARQVDAKRNRRKAEDVGAIHNRLRQPHYKYDSGREGDMPLAGFSPRKAATVLYIGAGFSDAEALLAKLGKHTTGKGCLYIKKLADVDQNVLETLVVKSVAARRARHPS